MADIVYIICPDCHKRFYAESVMRRTNSKFHCPYCDLYFFEKEITDKGGDSHAQEPKRIPY
jgi:hypothetical protein